jgi:hypothetical protein
VDAITDKPLANLDVTLRALAASGAFFGTGEKLLRYENDPTSATGHFHFGTSLEKYAALPLTTIKGYWLSVNRSFWSTAWMDAQDPGSHYESDPTPEDMGWDVMRDPLFRAKTTGTIQVHSNGPRVNTTKYFPMAVKFRRPCRQDWNANCLSFEETQNVRIPLIPVLDNPADCKEIHDPARSEQCRHSILTGQPSSMPTPLPKCGRAKNSAVRWITAAAPMPVSIRCPSTSQTARVIDGNTIQIVDDPYQALYVGLWVSGDKAVAVAFEGDAAGISSAMRDELIRQYLLKYPSSPFPTPPRNALH